MPWPDEGAGNGATSCPVVNTSGAGSVLLVFVVIVIVPSTLVLLWAVLHYFGPKELPCSQHYGKSADEAQELPDSVTAGAKDTNTTSVVSKQQDKQP